LLQKEVFTVHEQNDAVIALDMIEQEQIFPHAVVIKDRMPNIGAAEFIQKLGRLDKAAGLPVLVLTDDPSSRNAWRHLGAFEIIAKPASSRTILDLLYTAVSSS
jgi:DNA-binding NtrC family response regulator